MCLSFVYSVVQTSLRITHKNPNHFTKLHKVCPPLYCTSKTNDSNRNNSNKDVDEGITIHLNGGELNGKNNEYKSKKSMREIELETFEKLQAQGDFELNEILSAYKSEFQKLQESTRLNSDKYESELELIEYLKLNHIEYQKIISKERQEIQQQFNAMQQLAHEYTSMKKIDVKFKLGMFISWILMISAIGFLVDAFTNSNHPSQSIQYATIDATLAALVAFLLSKSK
mmetsp:Transcript_9976/g.17964  ORF Transcript_9976/g.17964 Transcript_9976/m.17964 type:complete len:228 (-) Transcript_9976:144-827(-)